MPNWTREQCAVLQFFRHAVNQFLIARGVLDIHADQAVGLVVDSSGSYFSSFPDVVHAGVRVAKLGNSSVRYELALYRNDEQVPAAAGHFVHVYVDRRSNRSVPIPDRARAEMEAIRV